MNPNITDLVNTVLVILVPLLVKGGEEFAKSAGKDAYDRAKQVLTVLRSRLSRDRNASDTLTRFEEHPEENVTSFTEVLDQVLAQDNNFADELRRLVTAMGPSLEIVQQMEEVEKIVGLKAKKLRKGNVTISQTGSGKDITGAEIDEIG